MKVNINLVLRCLFYVSYILNIDDHRQKFNDRVMELLEKTSKNSRILTKKHVKMVEQLKILENPLVPRTLPDQNHIKRRAGAVDETNCQNPNSTSTQPKVGFPLIFPALYSVSINPS